MASSGSLKPVSSAANRVGWLSRASRADGFGVAIFGARMASGAASISGSGSMNGAAPTGCALARGLAGARTAVLGAAAGWRNWRKLVTCDHFSPSAKAVSQTPTAARIASAMACGGDRRAERARQPRQSVGLQVADQAAEAGRQRPDRRRRDRAQTAREQQQARGAGQRAPAQRLAGLVGSGIGGAGDADRQQQRGDQPGGQAQRLHGDVGDVGPGRAEQVAGRAGAGGVEARIRRAPARQRQRQRAAQRRGQPAAEARARRVAPGAQQRFGSDLGGGLARRYGHASSGDGIRRQ